MTGGGGFEFPAHERELYARARRLESWSIAYIASAAAVLYVVMGSSQVMRTTWLEDLVSLVPPIAFLVGSRIALRPPSAEFPYGYHAAVSIAYLTAALALLGMGGFLLIEAGVKLIRQERPTIGGFVLFGQVVWAGWPMLAGLAYTAIPSFFLGRAKLRLAPRIHDKALFADADMNRADWLAELAAAVGVLGAGFGLWWADASAAALVSLNIVYDGWRNVSVAVSDLVARSPRKTDRSGPEPWPGRVRERLEALVWVEAARVRMREEGHVFFVEAFVVPRPTTDLAARIETAAEAIRDLDWRLYDVAITPVSSVADAERRARMGAGTHSEPRECA